MAMRHARLSGTYSALIAALAAFVAFVTIAVHLAVDGGGESLSASPAKPRGSAAPASAANWVGTWSSSPAGAEPRTVDGYPGMSIRNVVHTTVGGTGARVRLSNLFGQQPLTIGHASVAVAATPSTPTAAAGTMRRLTFGGNPSVTIPAGGSVVSDAARLAVPAAADLLVTTYAPAASGPVTYHPHARQMSYMARGDRTEDLAGTAYTDQSPSWRYVTAVDLLTQQADGAVVLFGDSITDGLTSTMGANRRWSDFLSERLRTESGAPRYSVLNQGISGNRVLTDGNGRPADNPSGLKRFQRDVLSRSGVRAVVISLGVNDILRTPHQTDPDAIVEGLRQLVRQAHARGLRVVGGTLMPFGGHRGFTPGLNAVREQVNARIRTGRVFDAVADFDAALRDPAQPDRLRPAYDCGDHLHPSDAGYRAMARAVNLQHLKGSVPAAL